MALGEDVGVEVVLCVRAPGGKVAELPAVGGWQRVHRQTQGRLGERRLHVREVEAVGVLPVELQDLVSRVQTCGEKGSVDGDALSSA